MSGTWMTTRAWLLMLPLLVIMIAVIGWPMVDTVRLSFTDAKLIGTGGQFVGVENYVKMLSSSNFLRALYATTWFAVISVTAEMVIGVLAALLLNQRFYGRAARLFYVAVERGSAGDDLPRDFNDFEVAARESGDAYRDGKLWGFIRHARISEQQASTFWGRMAELVTEFDQLPRSGETVYGFAVGVYPTDHPTLPRSDD